MRVIKGAGGILCLAALIATPVHASTPDPVPNAVKYKDAGVKPATGRSGSAAIQVRALRGRENTDIEVTTGAFESSTAPVGKLDKVQVKVFASDGSVIVTDNYRKGTLSGGYGTFAYSWPLRGQSLQVQANVSGIDPNRTDVVTVPATVQYRPDLTVSSIQAPNQVLLGGVVVVDAVVREANGDTGARANCVLKADGVVVDQANNIWVDGGDAVTVEFHTLFTTLGEKHLTVELTNVVPGDYDLTNNSAAATVNVISATTPLFYRMSAWDMDYDVVAPTRSHDEFTSSSPTQGSYVRDSTGIDTQTSHVAQFAAYLEIQKPVQFPVAVDSSVGIDGQPLVASAATIDENPNYAGNFSGPGYSNRCGEYRNQWHDVLVCDYHSEFYGVITDRGTVFTFGRAGSVTYASTTTSTTRWAVGFVDVYTSNGTGAFTDGDLLSPMPASLGSNVAVQSSFTDAASNHYQAAASVQLFPTTTTTFDAGETCYPYDYTIPNYGHLTGYGCSWPVYTAHGSVGTTEGTVQE